MTVNNPQAAQLDLLVNTFSEIQELRNFIVVEHLAKNPELNSDDFFATYQRNLQETKKTIWAQIQAHYGDLGNVDDLLNSAF